MHYSFSLIALTASLIASGWIQKSYALPNYVFILSDDQGEHGVGWRNPEIISPNIDFLSRSGVILDEFYTYKFCSPTRYQIFVCVNENRIIQYQYSYHQQLVITYA